MHLHRTNYFLSVLPKPISAIALILTISGHFYILHLVDHFAGVKRKNQGTTSEMVAQLLSDKTDNIAQPTTLQSQNGRNSTRQESHTSPQPLEEAPIDAQEYNEPYYYTSDELSQKPQVLNDLPADFSLPETLKFPEPLIVTLRISSTGMVDQVLISDEQVDDEVIQLITNAFKSMTFAAGRISDTAVSSEMRIEVWKNPAYQNVKIDK